MSDWLKSQLNSIERPAKSETLHRKEPIKSHVLDETVASASCSSCSGPYQVKPKVIWGDVILTGTMRGIFEADWDTRHYNLSTLAEKWQTGGKMFMSPYNYSCRRKKTSDLVISLFVTQTGHFYLKVHIMKYFVTVWLHVLGDIQ